MSRDWFDEWLDSDEDDELDLEPDEPERPVSWAEFLLICFIGGLVGVVVIVCAISVLVLLVGGVTLLLQEFAITKWLLVIGVIAGFLYWEKKASRRR